MTSQNRKFGLSEDPAPSDDLGGATEVEDIQVDDPTSLPEHDDSPEALQELLDDEAEFDLSTEAASIPQVAWGADLQQPDFAHTHTTFVDSIGLKSKFEFNWDVFDLLLRANHFRPRGKNDLVAFGLRGGKLVGADKQEHLQAVQIEDTRPDHQNFQCTLGIFDLSNKTLSAYTGSTVPNKQWMRNYYKKKNGIPKFKKTNCNLLPTGCYIYRVNAHGGGKIKPALRMTDPDNLKADAVCTVLRTHQDLVYSHDDFWDRSTPYDNIHCAYSDHSFSSAGCQTIKGANGQGAWGAFQDEIGKLGRDARIDYVLLTGREAAIASAIIAEGRQGDEALVQSLLGRLRVGSEGEAVTALQKKLGFNGSSYFGPSTKKRLIDVEAAEGLHSDGVYSPSDDGAMGWSIFSVVEPVPVPGLPQPKVSSDVSFRVSGAFDGNGLLWKDGPKNTLTFMSKEDAGNLEIAATADLEQDGMKVPIKVASKVEGIPAEFRVVVSIAAAPRSGSQEGPSPHSEPGNGSGSALTAETFDQFAPHARPDYRDAILTNGHTILAAHGIDATSIRLAHFLAQVSHESGGFAHRIESLNYSTAQRIHKMWPKRFPSVAAAQPFVHNEKGLAERVYGGRMGNTQPGDGFRYRGRGLIQLTGRTNYTDYADRLGVDLVGNPDLAFEPVTALRIAAEYWASRKLRGERPMNALADDDKLRAITYRINGGFTNFEHRESELARAKQIWGDNKKGGISTIVDRGDFSDDVRRLQLSLVSLGLLGGTVDGKFGYNTYKALYKFKTQFGLDGAGFADTATFEALDEAEAMESISVEEVEDLPIIGDEPEPIRDGVSLGEEEMLG